MTEIFLKLVNMSITASWLILAVLVLRLLLRKAPKAVRCFLWCLVGIKLLVPVSIESVFSLIPSAEVITTDILYATVPAIDTGINSVNQVVNPVLIESFSPNPGDSVNPLQMMTFVGTAIWLLGIALLLIYTLVTYVGLRSRVRDAIRLRGNIYQSEKVASPFVLGFVKPRIYVPFTLEGDELECVIAHEEAHIRRRDHLLKPIAFLILTAYWFNPLIWVAYILLCRDIELACDEKVMQQIGMDKKKIYSETLLNCSVSHKMIAACPIAFGEVGVKQRIRNVLNYKKPTFWIVVISVLACAVCIVCFMTEPKAEENDSTTEEVADDRVEEPIAPMDGLLVPEPTAVEILKSPPEMFLTDTLSSQINSVEITAGTYSWHYKDGDMMTGVEACGAAPLDAIKGRQRIRLKKYNGTHYAFYMAQFSLEPSQITVREYDLLDMGDMDAEVLSEIVSEEVFLLELKPRRIYEVIAEWDEEKLEEYGCYGTAYYAFATDDYMEASEEQATLVLGEKFTEEVNNFSGVTMLMEKYKNTEGDVEFFNATDKEIQYGDYYDIQIMKEGEWYSLQTAEGIAYHAIAYPLAPGTGNVWKVNWELVYGVLPVGNYRIVKDVCDYRAPGDYTKYYLAAEFEIE